MANNITFWVASNLNSSDVVLDLCAGTGNVMDGIYCKCLIALDIYAPYLEAFKAKRHDIIPLVLDARKIKKLFLPKSVDVITCLDGIEHFEENEAIALLKDMEKITRRKIIIFTTNGLTLNEPTDTWGIPGGDQYQKHKSGLTADYYKSIGYDVSVGNGGTNTYSGKPYQIVYAVRTL